MNENKTILSFDEFINKCRMLDEACRQWCAFIDEAPERRDGLLFTEFFNQICKQKYDEYLTDPAYRNECNYFAVDNGRQGINKEGVFILSLSKQVKNKLSQEYAEYMAAVRAMSKDDIISRIDVIADTTAIYHFLTSEDMDFDDREAAGLLMCDRPLDEIVGYWQYNHKDISEGIAESVTEISENALSSVRDDEAEDEDEWEQ